MFPQEHIDGFEKYWRRRKPGTSTAEKDRFFLIGRLEGLCLTYPYYFLSVINRT